MRFGLALPSFSFPDLDYAKAALLRDFAQRAETLGYESLWAVEHLLTARGLYGTAWLSPLETLPLWPAAPSGSGSPPGS
jgi:alkanesulfonate monooxygenase SsuD/methylene tetrahydromethanopterin reductase-like flavin-dependent oxidoreductase (luciferase family)